MYYNFNPNSKDAGKGQAGNSQDPSMLGSSNSVDPSGARPFGAFSVAQSQVANNAFPFAGNHGGNLAGLDYNIQNALPARSLGMQGMPSTPQQQAAAAQGRFNVGSNMPSGLQQLSRGLQGSVPLSRGGLVGGQPGQPGLVLNNNLNGLAGNPTAAATAATAAAAAAAAATGSGRSGLGMSMGPGLGGPGLGGIGIAGRTSLDRQSSIGAMGGAGGMHQRTPSGGIAMQGGPGNSHAGAGSSQGGVFAIPGAGGLGDELEPGVLDLSEFPSLGGMRTGSSGTSAGGGMHGVGGGSAADMIGQDPYGAAAMQKVQTHSEFSIQNEDFPALPGAMKGGVSNSMGDGEHQNMSMQGMGGYNPAMAVGATSSYEQLILSQQAVGAQGAAAAAMARGGAGMPALPKGAPPSSGKQQQQQPPDRFGLLGLLSVIRMQDPDLTTLALGTDLTTLGLNLNSPDNLYKTFGSPWSDAAARAEPEFTLPSCYLSQAPRLTPGSFTKFQEETLFYIFYSMPNDEAQVYAADELANRGWYFHKELKLWISAVPGTEPVAKNSQYERGSFFIFDTSSWERVRKDNFHLHYDQLEVRVQLPHHAQQQQQQQGHHNPQSNGPRHPQ